MKRWLKTGALGAVLFVAVTCAAYELYEPSRAITQREQYAALSAFITPGLTGDSHDLGSREHLVVILDHSSNGMFRLLWPSRLKPLSPAERLVMLLQSMWSVPLDRNFSIPAPYKLVTSTISPGYSEADQRASYGMLRFSRVTFNHNATRASFYMEHLCGMCGQGAFIVMEKRNGAWQVVDGAGTWIS